MALVGVVFFLCVFLLIQNQHLCVPFFKNFFFFLLCLLFFLIYLIFFLSNGMHEIHECVRVCFMSESMNAFSVAKYYRIVYIPYPYIDLFFFLSSSRLFVILPLPLMLLLILFSFNIFFFNVS